MTPKEISRAAGRIFTATIPVNWAIRSQEDQEDYGVDYEIELTTADDQPTGFIFKIQQKGQISLARNAAGDTVSFGDMRTAKLGYYLDDLGIPIVLVVVDITTPGVYWVPIQGNPQAQAGYREAVSRGQKTTTVHIPVVNCLPQTATALLDAVGQSMDWLLVQKMKETLPLRFTAAAFQTNELDSVVDNVREHLDSLRCEQIEQLIRKGERQQAFDLSRKLLNSESETSAMRMAAGMNMVRVFGGVLSNSDDASNFQKLTELRLDVAPRVLRAVRVPGTRGHLRIYGRFMLRSARLKLASEQTFGLWMSLQVQGNEGDPFTQFMTQAQRRPAVVRLLRDLRATYRLIDLAFRRAHPHLIPQMWSGAIIDSMAYIIQLRDGNSVSAAASLVEWFDRGGYLAMEVAIHLKSWRDLALCAITHVLLATPADKADQERRFAYARKMISQIPDVVLREECLNDLNEQRRLFVPRNREMTIEEEAQVHRQMAQSMGNNLTDPNDPIADIVNIGLRDLNPERVLKNCKQLYVSLGSHGVPAQMLGLPTAGSKRVHCIMHGYMIEGLTLDGIYEHFENAYCRNCPDAATHASDWRWNRKWQQAQDAKYGGDSKTFERVALAPPVKGGVISLLALNWKYATRRREFRVL